MEVKQFKNLLKLLYKNREELEVINLNFCFLNSKKSELNLKNLFGDVSLYKSLIELDAINLEFDLDEIEQLVKIKTLKSLSFGLKDSSKTNFRKDLSFEKLEQIRICFRLATKSVFYKLFKMILSNKIKNIEVYFIDCIIKHNRLESMSEFELDGNFLKRNLKEKSFSIERMLFNEKCFLSNELTILTSLLDKISDFKFSMPIDTDNSTQNLLEFLSKIRKVTHFEANINLDRIRYTAETQVLNGILIGDSYLNENYSNLFNSKLASISLHSSSKIPIMLKNIDATLTECKFITTLDLRKVHIHVTNSLCKELANMKSKTRFK